MAMAACFFHSQGATRGAPSSQNQSGSERAIDTRHHTKGPAPTPTGPRALDGQLLGWTQWTWWPDLLWWKGADPKAGHRPSLGIGIRGGGYKESPKSQTKNEVRDPQVSKLHPRDTGPFNAETPKEPSREGTPKGGEHNTCGAGRRPLYRSYRVFPLVWLKF